MKSIAEPEIRKVSPKQEVPLVAAVVLNWNDADETVACVRSILDSSYRGLSIVLVDNASTDGSREILRREFPDLPLLAQDVNGGYAAGNNAGIRYALEHGVDYILIVNNDIVVEEDFLSPMIDVAEKNPHVGVVTCTILYKSDTERVYYAGGRLSKWLCSGANRIAKSTSPRAHDGFSSVDFVNGSLMLVRREVFETMGLLVETFFMYFEDLEFSRRVSRKFQLAYVPAAKVYHTSGAGTTWGSYSETYLYYYTRNRFWVFASEPLYYRLYVLLFAVVNAIAKSLVISARFADKREPVSGRLAALWKGVRDGIRGENNR